MDSGIIVGRGNEVAFWHLTFQEFLAAKAVSSRLEDEQQQMLLAIPPSCTRRIGARSCCCWPASCTNRAGPNSTASSAACWTAGQAAHAGRPGPLLRAAGGGAQRPGTAEVHRVGPPLSRPGRGRDGDLRPRAVGRRADRERIDAADALGQAGDPRLDHHRDDYWVTIPAGRFVMGAQSKDARAELR